MTHVVVDPVTRIEGHLRIEAEVDGGKVQDAWSSATMFRGVELILKGRDPRDAWAFTQRICGVCTTVHAIASIRAVENAIGATPPPNARLLRNLIIASQCVQDHVIHFYHLHALDWVDIVSALSADPAKTSALAQSISDWPLSSTTYFAGVQDRVKAFVERGQLGPFANAYWGHPAYKLPAEANLMAVAHYLEALDWQREFIKIHAILGGKNPHLQSFLVGRHGDAHRPGPAGLVERRLDRRDAGAHREGRATSSRASTSRTCWPSPPSTRTGPGTAPASATTWSTASTRRRTGRTPELFLPSGVIRKRDLSKVEKFDPAKITEQVKHSWYEYDGGDDKGLHPFQGETKPKYTGPKPPYERLETDAKYSWLKSPRYDGEPMEVGPLARMLVAYASGQPRVKELVGAVLGKLSVGPEALFSTLGRVAARGHRDAGPRREDGRLAQRPGRQHGAGGSCASHDNSKWEPAHLAARGLGRRLPRGAARRARPLGPHPRRPDRQLPVRRAEHVERRAARRRRQPRPLRGGAASARRSTTPTQPIEILRTVHSFDPCIACGVHVVDAAAARARAREGPMSTARPLVDPGSIPPPADTDLVRVYVWEWPVRLAHWLIVISLFFLSWTGLYIGRPFLISAGEARFEFVMGTAKTIHFYAAIVFTMAVLVRVIWMFTGNRFSRWNKFLPCRQAPAAGACSRRSSTTSSLCASPRASSATTRSPASPTRLVFLLYFTMIATGIALRTVERGPALAAADLLLPRAALRRPAVGALDPPRRHVAPLGLRRAPRLQRDPDVAGRRQRHHRVDLLGLQVRPPRRRLYSGYRFLARKDEHG